jgi:hypothetical protein
MKAQSRGKGVALRFVLHRHKMRVGGKGQAPVALLGNDPVPVVPWWAPLPVWSCAENFASTRIGSPDRPARS